jgi:hypothetical protein
MNLLAAFLVVSALVAIWVALVRPWLRTKDWAAGFFAKIETFEITVYKKSESILWARFLQLLGAVLTALASLGEFDLTPLFPFLPDKWKWVPGILPMVVSLAGWIQERMRKDTTKPLEVVALPEDKPPELAAAVSRAEAATDRAVVAAETAKAQGAV